MAERSGWTSHGWWYGPDPEPVEGRPNGTAKCGGPGICRTCKAEAAPAAAEQIEQPLLFDAPSTTLKFVIGIDHDSGPLHAIEHRYATSPRSHVGTVCRTVAVVARKWGEFRRGNEHLAGRELCPYCAWYVALAHGTSDAEVAVYTPSDTEVAVMGLVMTDPLIVPRLLTTMLGKGDPDDIDLAAWSQMLGWVTAHRPVLLSFEDCADDACGHTDERDCYGDTPTAACATCSFRNGSWAGELEGWFWITVAGPCAPLLAAAERYGVQAGAS